MSRIFLSKSSHDERQAVALRTWLVKQDRSLTNEIFMDTDPATGMTAGKWKRQLLTAKSRCEAVICLLSTNWESSHECKTEYRTAEDNGKLIIPARLQDHTGKYTGEWQHFDLFTDGLPAGQTETVPVPDGPPVVFAKKGLGQVLQAIRGGIGIENFAWPPENQPDRPPYRGWDEWEEVDAAVFFGRDTQIVRALQTVRQIRVTRTDQLFVVLGPSGSGKSSFLRAGLLPRLRRDDRHFVLLDIMRPVHHALTGDTGLANAIYKGRCRLGLARPSLDDIQTACTDDPAAVRALLTECQQAAADRLPDPDREAMPTLVLPLDQAEELFGPDSHGEAEAFLNLVAELTETGTDGEALGLIVAATIRTDRYELMQNHPALDGIATELFNELRPMPGTQFEKVITGPATQATRGGRHPLRIAPDLVARLLNDSIGGIDTLPLLALTLRRLYDRYGGTGELTLSNYTSMGEMARMVQTVIDEVLSDDPQERGRQLELLRAAFIPGLVDVSPEGEPLRRVADWDELPEASRPLIDALVDSRLLVKDVKGERGGDVVVEVALESLLRQWGDLVGWIDDERENLKAATSLLRNAAAWASAGHNPDDLPIRSRLVDAETLAAKPDYRKRLEPARDFLTAARQAENERLEDEKRRQEAELQSAKDRRKAAEALAAAETRERQRAQADAATQRKLSRRLTVVAVIAVIGAVVAAILAVAAKSERDQAHKRYLESTAQRLMSEAPLMLASRHKGDDVQAFQELLAANRLATNHSEVPLLDALVKRSSTDLIDNGTDPVVGVAFANDGHRLAVADSRHLRIWETSSPTWQRDNFRKSARALPVKPKLTSVALSANGGMVAAGSEDGTVQVWNLNDQHPTPKLLGQPHQGRVTSVAFTSDGSQLASAGGDGIIDLSNPDGTHMRPITTGWAVFSVAFNPAGDRLAAAGADGAIRVWNVGKVPPAGGNVPADATFANAHSGGVMSIAFSPTDPLIASGGADNTVRFWDSETLAPSGRQLTTLTGKGHTAPVTSVAFSADGHRVVSGSNDRTVQLWDVGQRERIGDPMVGHQGIVLSVAFLGNDEIVSGGNEHALRFWNAVVGQPISEPLTGHGGPVTSVAITTDGRRIASASVDGTVWLWDSDTGSKIREMPEPADVVPRVAFNSVAFNWTGDMVASGSADGKIRLWHLTNDAVTTFDTGRPVTAVALNPAGDRLVFAGIDGQITLCELPSGRQTPLENRDHAMIFAVAFDPHGERFASGGIAGIVRVWDLAGRQSWQSDAGVGLTKAFSDKLLLADGHPGAVLSVAFSPDGRQVVSGSADWTAPGDTAGVVRRWDADKGTPLGDPAQVGISGMAIMGLAFSPQSPGAMRDRIFGGSFYPYNVELWNAANGDQFSFLGHNAPVVSVAVSADGRRIVSGSADQTVRIWPNPPTIPAADALCAKLTTTMSAQHWREWVSPTIPYDDHLCPGLPPTPDENPS